MITPAIHRDYWREDHETSQASQGKRRLKNVCDGRGTRSASRREIGPQDCARLRNSNLHLGKRQGRCTKALSARKNRPRFQRTPLMSPFRHFDNCRNVEVSAFTGRRLTSTPRIRILRIPGTQYLIFSLERSNREKGWYFGFGSWNTTTGMVEQEVAGSGLGSCISPITLNFHPRHEATGCRQQ